MDHALCAPGISNAPGRQAETMQTFDQRKHYAIAWLPAVGVLSILLAAGATCQSQKEPSPMNTASTIGRESPSGEQQVAIFAAGCFWGVEQTFREVEGVLETSVGYTGGHTENPTYKQVCNDTTGHAEAVRVVYDPQEVSYDKLLDVFWANHNPTTPNRQGPDVGSQYRSAVFYQNQAQADAARRSKEALEQSGRFSRPIVTEIVPAKEFYPAEDYHQQYLEKRGGGRCHI
jgi:peptide-methionine (S)-S-oxide reductase